MKLRLGRQMNEKQNKYCFALDLKEDEALIEEYKKWHSPNTVPKAIIKSIKDADIINLEIFLCGNRMFMIMETGPNFDPVLKSKNDLTNSEVIAWEELMWRFQKPLPFAKPNEKWIQMENIFSLSEQN